MALTDNLISFWELENTSWLDSHGSNNLTDSSGTGNVTVVSAKVNNGAQYVQANFQQLLRANNASLQTGNIDFFTSGWFKFTSRTSSQEIYSKGNEYLLKYDNAINKFEWRVFSGASPFVVNSVETLADGVWYFVNCWHDSVGNEIAIQVDNGTPTTLSHSTGVDVTTGDFTLGAGPTAAFDGIADQFGFWKRLLNSSERGQLWNSGSGLSYAALSGAGGALPFITTLGAKRI